MPDPTPPPSIAGACKLWVYDLDAGAALRRRARAIITDYLRRNLAFCWDAGPRRGLGRYECWTVYLNSNGNGPAFVIRPLPLPDRSVLNYCDPAAVAKLPPLLKGRVR